MADFLSRLAARNLGMLPLARPTVAPVFAPASAVTVEGVAPAPTRPRLDASSDAAETRAPATSRQPAPEKPDQSHASVPVTPPRGTDPADDGVRSASFRPVVERIHDIVFPRESSPQPVMPVNVVDKVDVERALRNIDAVGYRPLREDRVPEAAAEVRPQPPRHSGDVPPTSSNRIEDRVVWPSLPPKTAQSAKQREIEPETSTVEVSIGRVEVRAVFPEAQPAPVIRRAASSTLSLADYLKERDRGSR
jgi:hypothetical protein